MSVLDVLVSNVLAAAQGASPFAVGTVTAVDLAAAADGNALVTVDWRGSSVRAAYCASYTPDVGHVVFMARFGPQLLVLDRIVGTPPALEGGF